MECPASLQVSAVLAGFVIDWTPFPESGRAPGQEDILSKETANLGP